MLNIKPVVDMEVTFKGMVELGGGQELSRPTGKINNVFGDEIVVLFEDVVSDKGGHVYNDVVWVKIEDLPDLLEGFEWVED